MASSGVLMLTTLKSLPLALPAATFCLLAVGCTGGGGGGDGGDGCATGGSGTVQLSVAGGIPSGTTPTVDIGDVPVVVTGAGPTDVTVDGGEVAFEAERFADAGTPVRNAYDPVFTPASACVESGETVPVEVAFPAIPTSGKLWASQSNAATELVAFDAGDVGAGGTVTASAAADIPVTSARGVAFDAAGNLWVAEASGTVKRFGRAAVATTGTVSPDVTLDGLGVGIPGPTAVAFDAAGNLWVSLAADDMVVRFTPAEIAASGSPSPAVEIGGAGSTLDGIAAIAFDASGNLWLSSDDRVHRYDASRLDATDTGTPDRSITAEATAGGAVLTSPAGLAFDADGNLWVSYFGPNVIARIDAADLAGTGAVAVVPDHQIELTVSAILDGLAFDEEGGLWTPAANGSLARLSAAQLTSTGSITPAILLDGADIGAVKHPVVFPAPAGLPLFHAMP